MGSRRRRDVVLPALGCGNDDETIGEPREVSCVPGEWLRDGSSSTYLRANRGKHAVEVSNAAPSAR